MPEVVPTVATVVLLLAQVPPGMPFDSVVVVPTQIPVVPLITVGAGVTVMVVVV